MTTSNDVLNAALFAAIKRAPKLEPGDHVIDAVVHITGVLRQGEDYESRVAAAVPWQRIALAALNLLNANSRKTAVLRGLNDRSDLTPYSKETAEARDKELKAEVIRLSDGILDATTKVCKGKLTGTVHVDVLSEPLVCNNTSPFPTA